MLWSLVENYILYLFCKEGITNYFFLTPTHAVFAPKAKIENFFQLPGCKVGFVDSAVFMSHLSSQTLNSEMH